MRFMSKGMALPFMYFSMRGSFITRAFTLSRSARERYTIQEKNTVSSGFAFARRPKGTPKAGVRSSPMHSWNSIAPCSRNILPAMRAMRR
jgi:hypothetical protein